MLRYESLTRHPTQAPEVSFVDHTEGYAPVKHTAASVFNVVNLNGKQVAHFSAPKCAGAFIEKAILVGEAQAKG